MSVVLADPGGFAIDWDWQRRLTVWAIEGDRFGVKITEHKLGTRPGSEIQAARAARNWWRGTGRSQALERAGSSTPSTTPPG